LDEVMRKAGTFVYFYLTTGEASVLCDQLKSEFKGAVYLPLDSCNKPP
jgi:hypothetical protein